MKPIGMTIDNNEMFEHKKQSIQELMNHQGIQEVLQKYHLTQKDVEDHWVDFLNYQKDLDACLGCRGLQDCLKSTQGMKKELAYQDHRVVIDYTPCQYGKEKFEDYQILDRILLKNVSTKLLLTKSGDLSITKQSNTNAKKILVELTEYLKNPTKKGFYLYGNPGIGKSTIMGWFVRVLAQQNKTCGYIHLPTFLMDLKSQFGEEGIHDSIYLLKEVEYLVIDDIGGENFTTWSRDEILSSVLAYRAQKELPTFFTSVYSFEELKKIYTTKNTEKIRVERLVDRMKAVAIGMNLIGEDLR